MNSEKETQVAGNTTDNKRESNLIRFDKNLAASGVDFVKAYGSDGQLIFDLIFYICHTYQKDLFGYGSIDPVEFAKVMGYKRSNLLIQHNEPAQFKNDKYLRQEWEVIKDKGKYDVTLSNGDYPMYTVLDNALFRAGRENLVFSKVRKDVSQKEKVFEMEFINLVSSVKKHYSDGNKKISYSLKLSPVIEEHLNKYFMLGDTESIVKLRKKNSVALYMYLKNMKSSLLQLKQKVATPNFDYICKIAMINIKDASDKKKKLKLKLDEILKSTELNYTYRFETGTGKFNYDLVVEFLEDKIIIEKGELYSAVIIDKYNHQLKTEFDKLKIPEASWENWSGDNNQNLQVKFNIFLRVVIEITGATTKYDQKNKLRICNYFKINSNMYESLLERFIP